MSETIIEIKGLKKHFGNNEVLKGIDFEMKKGEKIVILGSSGSGKSTILRCINGLETYNDGEICFKGDKLGKHTDLCKVRAHIGMVFQRFNIFSHMTVLQNVIEAPVHVKKMKKAEATELGEALLEKVGLSDKMNSYAKELSGGQQQRVAIARALAMQPDLMLFDEPTSALDPELVGEVLEVMKQLALDGMSMIVVTHEMGFASQVADKILFIDEGTVLHSDTPKEFFGNPSNDRIKSFLSKIHTPGIAI